MPLFKIWDCSRNSKIFLVSEDYNLEQLKLKASTKLHINGTSLVLESDGTVVDDDDTLRYLNNETLMLLQVHELWQPPEQQYVANLTTLTNVSASSSNTSLSEKSNTSCADENFENNSTDSDSCSKTHSTDARLSENTWKAFVIPWNKLKETTLKDCEQGIRNKRSISDVIHVVADAMLNIKLNIPAKAIKIVAHKIITKFPEMFEDVDDDGVVLGDGSHTLFCKLKDHIKYLNRSHKRPNQKDNFTVPLQHKKKMLSAKAGCSHWQPELQGMQISLDEIKVQLRNINFEILDEKIIGMLDATFPIQRAFLNNPSEPPSIDKIMEEWPILLSRNAIYWHYHKLMTQDINNLGEAILNKLEKFIVFNQKAKLKIPISNMENEDSKILTVLSIVCTAFKEDINLLYFVETGSHLRDYSIVSPGIVAVTRDHDQCSYAIFYEKKKVLEETSLRHAVQVVFALYYNFNLVYPKNVSHTLEFLQKYFLKIHPDQGTKNKKAKDKVIALMVKLRDC